MNRPRYADVAATLALVLALGGTAYAASLPKHSVGKQQLKHDAVTSKKIKNGKVRGVDLAPGAVGGGQLQDGAVTGAKIANGTVDRPDLASGSVGTGELTANAVNGSKVANRSLSLDDLVGADVTTTVTYVLPAGACTPLALTVPGASAGQAGLVSLTGGVEAGDVVLGAVRVGNGSASVRACVRQADVDEGHAPGTSTSDAAKLKLLEQEIRELKRANEILTRAASFFGSMPS